MSSVHCPLGKLVEAELSHIPHWPIIELDVLNSLTVEFPYIWIEFFLFSPLLGLRLVNVQATQLFSTSYSPIDLRAIRVH